MNDTNMDEKIKDWYKSKYESDDLSDEIKPDVTFEDLNNDLPNVYEVIGVYDSIIRERIFIELAYKMKVKYDVIYNGWLGRF
jgi:predicted glycosyltransferase